MATRRLWTDHGIDKGLRISVRWRKSHVEGEFYSTGKGRSVYRTYLFSGIMGSVLPFGPDVLYLLGVGEGLCISTTFECCNGEIRLVGLWGKMDYPDFLLIERLRRMTGSSNVHSKEEMFSYIVRLWSAALSDLRSIEHDVLWGSRPVMRVFSHRFQLTFVFVERELIDVVST